MTQQRHVKPATSKPCAHCPWRVSNQVKRHADGWYTKANLRRLWGGMRRGEDMTCHPTDPDNPVPDGGKPVPEGAQTIECAGSLVLKQRELMRFQKILLDNPGISRPEVMRMYRAAHPRGLTQKGLIVLLQRAMFGGTLLGGLHLTRVNLNEPDIGAPDITPWTKDETR